MYFHPLPPDPTYELLPTLFIGLEAWHKLQAYAQQFQAGMAGFGFVQLVDDGFLVAGTEDLFIPRQTVTIGSTEVSGVNFAQVREQARQNGQVDTLRLQWHARPSSVRFTHDDHHEIERSGALGMPWLLSLITNRHGYVQARLDQYFPFRMGGAIQIVLEGDENPAITEAVEKEAADLVRVHRQLRTRRIQPPTEQV